MTTQIGKSVAIKSNKNRLEGLLSHPRSATIWQLRKALDWQLHSIHAAISRLRRGGAAVSLDHNDRTPAHRIVSVT